MMSLEQPETFVGWYLLEPRHDVSDHNGLRSAWSASPKAASHDDAPQSAP
jgi:hypothetical protein